MIGQTIFKKKENMLYDLTFYDANDEEGFAEQVFANGSNIAEAINSAIEYLNEKYPEEDHDWRWI